MKNYRHPNGRVQSRSSNGRFRKTTLADFGVADKDINSKGNKMICQRCGKSCMPILLTTTHRNCACGGKMTWQNKTKK